MPDVATRTIVAREAPSAPGGNRRIGPGRALAGEIWGAFYVGTTPSHGLPVGSNWNALPERSPDEHVVVVTLAAEHTTLASFSRTFEDLYWAPLCSATTEVGMNVWGGHYVISMPARATPAAPDFLYWTREGCGASNILFIGEAKLTNTDPADRAHLPAWRRIFESRWSVPLASGDDEPPVATRDAQSELRALADSTRLTIDELGGLFGASRRTMYNWLAGRPIREATQSRIFRLRDAIAPIEDSRDAVLVRDWLLQGDPSPAQLAAGERWDELETRVHQDTAPLRPADGEIRGVGIELPKMRRTPNSRLEPL
jgi:hypothetical protein